MASLLLIGVLAGAGFMILTGIVYYLWNKRERNLAESDVEIQRSPSRTITIPKTEEIAVASNDQLEHAQPKPLAALSKTKIDSVVEQTQALFKSPVKWAADGAPKADPVPSFAVVSTDDVPARPKSGAPPSPSSNRRSLLLSNRESLNLSDFDRSALPDQERAVFKNPLFGLDDDLLEEDGATAETQHETENKARAEASDGKDDVDAAPKLVPHTVDAVEFDQDGMLLGDFYPGSKVRRCPVPVVDWRTSAPEYNPPTYEDIGLADDPDWADPMDLAAHPVQFNQLDSTLVPPLDRISHDGWYQVVEGVPRNPRGRTGIAGRGLFTRWGPNHATHPLVVRWAFTPEGDAVYRSGRRVAEFVAVMREDSGKLSLPEDVLEANELAPASLRSTLTAAVWAAGLPADERKAALKGLEDMLTNGDKIYRGYVDDDRNTDNAWLETVVTLFTDPTGDVLENLPLSDQDPYEPHWQLLSEDLLLHGDQRAWLHLAAKELNCFWSDAEDAVTAMVSVPVSKESNVANIIYQPPDQGSDTQSIHHSDDGVSIDPRELHSPHSGTVSPHGPPPTSAMGGPVTPRLNPGSDNLKRPSSMIGASPPLLEMAQPTRDSMSSSSEDSATSEETDRRSMAPSPVQPAEKAATASSQTAEHTLETTRTTAPQAEIASTPSLPPPTTTITSAANAALPTPPPPPMVVSPSTAALAPPPPPPSLPAPASSAAYPPPPPTVPARPAHTLPLDDSSSLYPTAEPVSYDAPPAPPAPPPSMPNNAKGFTDSTPRPAAPATPAIMDTASLAPLDPGLMESLAMLDPGLIASMSVLESDDDLEEKKPEPEPEPEVEMRRKYEEPQYDFASSNRTSRYSTADMASAEGTPKMKQRAKLKTPAKAVSPVPEKPPAPAEPVHDPMADILQKYKDIVADIKQRVPFDDANLGTFEGKYLGSVPTDNPSGKNVIEACIKRIPDKKGHSCEAVELQVTAHKLVIYARGRDVAVHDIPIKNVSFTGVDAKNNKIFAFIANNQKQKTIACHVMLCKVRAQLVSEAVTAAFEAAQQLRVDPFHITRDALATPEALIEPFEERQLWRADLHVSMIIGHGQFGKVYLATHSPSGVEAAREHKSHNKVAVKLMKVEASHTDVAEFMQEAHMLTEVAHERCLKLVGVCMEKLPWLIVVEFMQFKDLGVVLRQAGRVSLPLRSHEQLTFMVQVAEGLEYLASKRIIHRDIAARNIMLHHDNVVKIGDFGLTRMLPPGQDYWRLDKAGRLPVKYMAIETLTLKRFGLESDVWAFGVYMWEILSGGANPWEKEGVATKDVRKALIEGRRIGKPTYKPSDLLEKESDQRHLRKLFDDLFDMAASCWLKQKEERPTMKDLRYRLQERLDVEIDFHGAARAIRDVGKTVFEGLENAKRRKTKRAQRGGSLIQGGR
eukprot:TRINITY_DN12219_c1_g3_i12.p1 TRINITY_DN12219_c1_g3~~TRINITY_DN12219_c1_g3_i12.p1  ORF type:complete len:1414 (+),score=379.52 TRINITY_DN12219_c1_g3_i12:272-4513(+)